MCLILFKLVSEGLIVHVKDVGSCNVRHLIHELFLLLCGVLTWLASVWRPAVLLTTLHQPLILIMIHMQVNVMLAV